VRPILIVCALLLSPLVHAEAKRSGKARLEVPPTLTEPADVIPVPRLWVAISSPARDLRPADFEVMPADDPSNAFPGQKLVRFRESDEPLSMIVLVDGKVRFIGDPAPEPVEGESEARAIPGAWDELHEALDVLSRARPHRTRAALWVYGETVVPRTDLGDPAAIGGEALGVRTEFAKIRTSALRLALETAQARLADEPGRRIVVVIGDGTDTVSDADYARVRDALESASIEVHFLLAKSGGQAIDTRTLARLGRVAKQTGGRVYRAESLAELPPLAENLVVGLDDLYTVEFALADLETSRKLPFDGAKHELVIRVKDDELDLSLMLDKWDFPPEVVTGSTPIWLWLLAGTAGLVLLVGTVVVMRPRPDAEEEEPVDEEPAPPPPPPHVELAPPAPQQTQQIDLGLMPVVGWVVPLSGPHAHRTYKLRSSGRSLIGTGPDCDVLVVDPYVSREHAEIVVDGECFRLHDRGSTNGVKVDGARVSSYELVDNTVFTVGQTELVFKSIN